MRTFVELAVKGGRRAVVDTSAIIGYITSPARMKDDIATPEAPVTVILRNAHPIEVVGMEPVMILAALTKIAEKADMLKESGKDRPVAIEWLDLDAG